MQFLVNPDLLTNKLLLRGVQGQQSRSVRDADSCQKKLNEGKFP